MTLPLLLITGATGFIGFKVLLHALEAGYTVPAAVRSHSGSSRVLSNPKINALVLGDRFSFIEVPDILREDSYNEALKNVVYVIHVTSPLPLPSSGVDNEIYQHGVKGTANILASALKSLIIKRIVITPSIVSNMPHPRVPENLIDVESRVPSLDGPFTNVFSVYRAFQIIALNVTDDFCFIYGQNEMATDVTALLSGSNRLLFLMLRDQSFSIPQLACVVRIDEVAMAHLLALDEKFRGKPDFGVTVLLVYDEASNIVNKNFPQSVEDGTVAKAHQPSMAVHWDASKTEEVLGLKFKVRRYGRLILQDSILNSLKRSRLERERIEVFENRMETLRLQASPRVLSGHNNLVMSAATIK